VQSWCAKPNRALVPINERAGRDYNPCLAAAAADHFGICWPQHDRRGPGNGGVRPLTARFLSPGHRIAERSPQWSNILSPRPREVDHHLRARASVGTERSSQAKAMAVSSAGMILRAR